MWVCESTLPCGVAQVEERVAVQGLHGDVLQLYHMTQFWAAVHNFYSVYMYVVLKAQVKTGL